ncbi:MAG: YqeG family HAD IIIA-type phosphatase [Clostridia bacterium]|nr:YqeG family HAD IIIA-type phosphatase [Clostridia bacterium]
MRFLKPSVWVETIHHIDYQKLYDSGKRAIYFDIDNTMASYNDPLPDEKLHKFVKNLHEIGFKVAVLSNAKSGRAKLFADALALDFEGKALKPRRKGFNRLSERLGVKADEVVMIGDQLFTDIWGGNRFGCYTVLVTPIDRSGDPGFVKFKRIFETPVIKKLSKSETN